MSWNNQPGPWHYYVPVLVVGAFPWTAFLPATLIYHVRRMRQDGRSVLLILWMGMTFLFYSVAGTKLPNYILPLFPAAAIATARLWAVAVWERDPRASALLRLGSWLLLVMVGVVATTVLVILQPRYPAEFALLRTHLQLLVSLPLVAALLAVIPVRRPLAALGALLLFTSATYGVLVLATLPRVEALRPMKPLAEVLKAALQPGNRIVGVGWTEPASVIYYAGHPAAQALPDAASVRRAACGGGRVFVVASRMDYEHWMRNAFPGALDVTADRMGTLILRTNRPIACAP